MEPDERSSLLSFTDGNPATGGYIEAVLTRTTSKADSTLNEYPKKHVPRSSFLQSVFNSTNILLGIGILAMPLGFKVSICVSFYKKKDIYCARTIQKILYMQ